MNTGSQLWDLPKVEEYALQLVNLIQRCVYTIRSVKEFTPATLANRTKTDVNPIHHVLLYTAMESNGMVDEVDKIQELVNSTIPTLKEEHIETMVTLNERSRLVHRVLLPLVSSLKTCYSVLDQIPDDPPPAAQTRGRRKQKPSPPRGMLSIQNYTDIAVLLEFLVCTSILPNLQRFVLASVQDRARHQLPKSLAGRIPRSSLLWGCAVQNSVPVKMEDSSRVVYELQQTAQALGSLVLLDRFRPMLLPRHLVDVYAAMFQAEAFESQNQQQKSCPKIVQSMEYQKLRSTLLGDSLPSTSSCTVDTYSHARACQALLFQGTKAPLWLRQRVSILLTDLACRDLAAIVQVFVHEGAAAAQDMSGASMRLARALTGPSLAETTDKMKPNYHRRLCLQLLRLLDVAVVPTEIDVSAKVDARHEAGILTVWAVLDQLPLGVLLKHMLPLLKEGLLPECSEDDAHTSSDADPGLVLVHKTVRRIGTLLSFVPSATNPSKVCRLFLHPILPCIGLSYEQTGIETNLFAQLLRIASNHSVLHSTVKKDAVWSLTLLVQSMCQSSFKSTRYPNRTAVGGTDVAAMALLHSVAPSTWDLAGYQYCILSSHSKKSDFDSVGVKMCSDDDIHKIHALTKRVEERAKLVVANIIAPMSSINVEREPIDASGQSRSEEKAFNLPSRIFNLLLLVYFSTTSSSKSDAPAPQLPAVFNSNRSRFALVAMTLLPLLCEECSPLSLLLGGNGGDTNDTDKGNGVLGMIKLILDCASSSFGGDKVLEVESSTHPKSEVTHHSPTNRDSHPFSHCDTMFSEIMGFQGGQGIKADDDDTSNNYVVTGNETLVSISSLVLSMLVALLELGSLSRKEEDEDTLKYMLPSLLSLATYTELEVSNGDTDEHLAVATADLAEMASHAMALISYRPISSAPLESHPSPKKSSRGTNLEDLIKRAEKDLKSEQPPIRARGVIELRRLARGYLSERTIKDQTVFQDKPLIEVIGEDVSRGGADYLGYDVQQILRVLIISLADSESYVYLAGIQTIVALGDVAPQKVVPALGRAVCRGVATFTHASSDEASVELQLTDSQRVKLTESLLFTIRRRGSAVYQFVPYLMDLMMFGYQESEASMKSNRHKNVQELEQNIRAETHKYFLNGNEPDKSSETDPEHEREGRRVRVSTGGPVFDSEECDLVRAACISVVVELVSVSQPSVVAGYCHHLVRLATTALQLDRSRPVRRAAALLCRELYEAILREHDETSEMVQKNEFIRNDVSLAVEMVSSEEEVMFSTLELCAMRVNDPSTVSRCQEALNSRMIIEREGVFVAAMLVANSMKLDDDNPVAKIVRTRLQGSTEPKDDRSVVRLDIDPNSMKLL